MLFFTNSTYISLTLLSNIYVCLARKRRAVNTTGIKVNYEHEKDSKL